MGIDNKNKLSFTFLQNIKNVGSGRLWALEWRGTLQNNTCAAQEAQESACQVPTF